MKFIRIDKSGKVLSGHPLSGIVNDYPKLKRWAETAMSGDTVQLDNKTILKTITEYRFNKAKKSRNFFKYLNEKNREDKDGSN